MIGAKHEVYAKRALRAGASGYVVKRETTRRICQAIREVLHGFPCISLEVAPSSDPSTSEEILNSHCSASESAKSFAV